MYNMKLIEDTIDSIPNIDELIDKSYNGTCFAYSWFMKLKTANKIIKFVNDKNILVGFMPLFLNEDGTNICQNTMYIPYGGPVFFNVPSTTRRRIKYIRIIESLLADYLKEKFTDFSFSIDEKIIDVMPFIRKDIIPEVRYTYKIDLGNTIDDIYNGFGHDRKKEIKKAIKGSLEFYLDSEMKYFSPEKCVEWEKKYNFPSSAKFVEKYIKKSIDVDRGMCFIAKKGDIIYGAVYMAWDSKTAYILYSYFDSNYDVGAISFLYYNIFKYLKEVKKLAYIDFEGSVYETVENYNISFGAYQARYYNLHYSKNNKNELYSNMYKYYEK